MLKALIEDDTKTLDKIYNIYSYINYEKYYDSIKNIKNGNCLYSMGCAFYFNKKYNLRNYRKKAQNYFTIAANKYSNPFAIYMLATFNEDENIFNSIKLYKKSGQLGCSKAYLRIGEIYKNGWNDDIDCIIRPNFQKTIKYYKLSSKQENPIAWKKLGDIYSRGGEFNAKEYFKKSAELGYEEGVNKLKQLYNDVIIREYYDLVLFQKVPSWLSKSSAQILFYKKIFEHSIYPYCNNENMKMGLDIFVKHMLDNDIKYYYQTDELIYYEKLPI